MAYLKLFVLIGFIVKAKLFFSLLLLLLLFEDDINLRLIFFPISLFLNLISKDSLFELFLAGLLGIEILSGSWLGIFLLFSLFILFGSVFELSLFHPKSGRKSSFLGVLLTSSLFLLVAFSTFSSSTHCFGSISILSLIKVSTNSLEKLCFWALNFNFIYILLIIWLFNLWSHSHFFLWANWNSLFFPFFLDFFNQVSFFWDSVGIMGLIVPEFS